MNFDITKLVELGGAFALCLIIGLTVARMLIRGQQQRDEQQTVLVKELIGKIGNGHFEAMLAPAVRELTLIREETERNGELLEKQARICQDRAGVNCVDPPKE